MGGRSSIRVCGSGNGASGCPRFGIRCEGNAFGWAPFDRRRKLRMRTMQHSSAYEAAPHSSTSPTTFPMCAHPLRTLGTTAPRRFKLRPHKQLPITQAAISPTTISSPQPSRRMTKGHPPMKSLTSPMKRTRAPLIITGQLPRMDTPTILTRTSTP